MITEMDPNAEYNQLMFNKKNNSKDKNLSPKAIAVKSKTRISDTRQRGKLCKVKIEVKNPEQADMPICIQKYKISVCTLQTNHCGQTRFKQSFVEKLCQPYQLQLQVPKCKLY